MAILSPPQCRLIGLAGRYTSPGKRSIAFGAAPLCAPHGSSRSDRMRPARVERRLPMAMTTQSLGRAVMNCLWIDPLILAAGASQAHPV